jgi:anthranilate synthase/phosphoribosyltransferase
MAKHGNRAVSSKSGAADFFEALGVNIMAAPDKTAELVKKTGFGFLMAPVYHSAMRFAAPIRKALGIKTIFNVLGPLLNPANAEYEVLGVYSKDLLKDYAHAAKTLGAKRVMVVNSEDGYDEISLTGTFKINTNKYEKVFDPSDFRLPLTNDYDPFGGRTAQEAAAIFDSVLENRATEGQKNTVLANAAVAIQCMDQKLDILEALDIARESLESGKALSNFKKFVELNS